MRKLISYAVIASFFVVVPLWAHEGHEDAKGDMKGMKDMPGMDMDKMDAPAKGAAKEVKAQLKGEFVELGCYVNHDSTGTDHKDCADKCARAGAPIALKEEGTGKLYVVITDDHFVNPAKKAFGKIGFPVMVQGITKSAGTLDLLIIRKVDVIKATAEKKTEK